ncbi:adenylate kinase [bacterium 3DAC]|nr:adenylate kinase [Dictyoglomota bacterium]UZN23310.1 adenylate kinase [bacterium 3DAC]
MKKMYILFGPPGSGKGTQASLLVKNDGFAWLSTGEVFRRNIREGTPLGKQVEAIVKSGGLVSDELVMEIVKDEIAKMGYPEKLLLDGVPRTVKQAEILDDIAKEFGYEVYKFVEIVVPEEEVIRRLTNRYVCPICGYVSNKPGKCPNDGATLEKRADDNEETVRRRLEEYHKYADPVINWYKKKGIYVAVDGVGSIEEVYKRLKEALE